MDFFARVRTEREEQDKQWGGVPNDDTLTPERFIDYIMYQANKAWRDFGYIHCLENIKPIGKMDAEHMALSAMRKRFVKMAALAQSGDQRIDRLLGIVTPIDELSMARDSLFNACAQLGLIDEALGISVDESGGAGPILDAIADLKAQPGVDFRAGVQAIIAKIESGEWDEKAPEVVVTGDVLLDHLSTVITELYCDLEDATEGREIVINLPGSCEVPPAGWSCSRTKGHSGPCAASPIEGAFTHELKTDPDTFKDVLTGDKTHEIRRNDRDFKVGDTLLLRETRYSGTEMSGPEPRPLEYTGRTATRIVSHILFGYGLQPGWCILSFAPSA